MAPVVPRSLPGPPAPARSRAGRAGGTLPRAPPVRAPAWPSLPPVSAPRSPGGFSAGPAGGRAGELGAGRSRSAGLPPKPLPARPGREVTAKQGLPPAPRRRWAGLKPAVPAGCPRAWGNGAL